LNKPTSLSGPEANLAKALKARFPGERVECLAKLLSKALERDYITYKQIDMPDEEKEDLILFVYTNRLLMPARSGRTMAWEDSSITLDPDESYKMPGVIARIVQYARETGRWEPDRAILDYLLELGDRRAIYKLKLFQSLKARAKNGKVTPHTLYRSAAEVGSCININQTIAEFKGAGMISPCLHRSVLSGVIEYEINPSL